MECSNMMRKILLLFKVARDNYEKAILDVSVECGITSQEAEVLLFFYNNSEFCYAKDAVIYRGYSKSYVSKAITKLVSRDYIEIIFDENDKRNKKIIIKDNVNNIIDRLKIAQVNAMSFLHKNISDSELKIFFNVINKMHDNIVKLEEGK